MNYRFNNTDDGVKTDKKVQAAVAKLDTLDARGTLIIEAGYKGQHDAYCKISGTSLGQPVVTGGKKVGEAVNGAVKSTLTIIRNDRNTIVAKKGHERKKATKEEETTLEM
ncbi:MAG: hypothetical protein J6Q15_03235 [Clostridia bacterium]|nr:hypothetical protein [Clostridia bacterium]